MEKNEKSDNVESYSYGKIADNYIGIFARPGKALIFIVLIIILIILIGSIIAWVV